MNSETQNTERNDENSIKQLREQANNLEALRIILRDKKIAETIRKHFDYNSARTHLVDRFNLNKEQAEFILNMPSDEFQGLVADDIEKQYNDLKHRITELKIEHVLANLPKSMTNLIDCNS